MFSESDKVRVGTIVLCGGGSTRMGFDKSRLVLGEQSFLERIIRAVAPFSMRTVVVGASVEDFEYLQDTVLEGVTITADQNRDHGPLEGIRAGLESLGNTVDVAFVTSCDVPLIKGEVIDELCRSLGRFEAVVPVRGKRTFGLTALYRPSALERIEQMVSSGRLKVALLATELNANRISIDSLRNVDPELDSITNINSIEDYADLLKRFSQPLPPEIQAKIDADGNGRG